MSTNTNEVDDNIDAAGRDICGCVLQTLQQMEQPLLQKFKLTSEQLTYAILQAELQMLATAVAGLRLGPDSDGEQLEATGKEFLAEVEHAVTKAICGER